MWSKDFLLGEIVRAPFLALNEWLKKGRKNGKCGKEKSLSALGKKKLRLRSLAGVLKVWLNPYLAGLASGFFLAAEAGAVMGSFLPKA